MPNRDTAVQSCTLVAEPAGQQASNPIHRADETGLPKRFPGGNDDAFFMLFCRHRQHLFTYLYKDCAGPASCQRRNAETMETADRPRRTSYGRAHPHRILSKIFPGTLQSRGTDDDERT